jgi:AraC-like DNA-binding protein
MSVRVLQRRLSEFGLTYSQLVDEVRLELARRLFENSRLNLSDIAQELGYSDAAHFTRAFVRWTGVTPSAFRRRGR